MAKIGAWPRPMILQYQHHAKHLELLHVMCMCVFVFEDVHLSGELELPGDGAIGA